MSNLSFGALDQAFAGDPVLTATMLDRLLHRNQVIQIEGDSYRLKDKCKAGIFGPAREKQMNTPRIVDAFFADYEAGRP